MLFLLGLSSVVEFNSHSLGVNVSYGCVCVESELKPWYKQQIIMCYEGAVVNTRTGECLLQNWAHMLNLPQTRNEFEWHSLHIPFSRILHWHAVTIQFVKVLQSINNLWCKMLRLNNLWILDYEIMKSKYEKQMTSRLVFELEWCAACFDSWN